MRSLTLATRQALMAQETGEVILALITINHPELVTPMRFVNDHQNIVSNGETYERFPFDIQLPDDTEEVVTRIGLTIDNVDRRIVEAVRIITSAPTLILTIIRAAEADVPVAGPIECTLRNVTHTALVVSGDLHPHENVNDERFPQHIFSPATVPALFGNG